MTTQVLMSTVIVAKPALPAIPAPEPASVTPSTTPKRQAHPIADRLVAPSSCPIDGAEFTHRLPYGASLQAELLCLQAEADALLQKLQAIQKAKRSNSSSR